MFKMFTNGSAEAAWPLHKIVAALKGQYGSVDTLGEDGPIKVFGIEDNGVNFVVAVVQSAPGSGKVVELGFLARFVGFPVTVDTVERLNRNLHVAVASLEGADLFLMAGLQVSGPYDDGQFALLIEAWRRDLAVTMHGIGGGEGSIMSAFPAGRLEAARQFAVNKAPEGAGNAAADMLKRFLGANADAGEFCGKCAGRGRRGLIARTCEACDGTGFVATRR